MLASNNTSGSFLAGDMSSTTIEAERLHNFAHVTQVFMLVAYVTMFILSVILIAYMRYNRSEAFKGDTNAGRKILLPAFEPLLWILGVTGGVYTLFLCIALTINLYNDGIPDITYESFYAGRQFVFMLVIVFMYQKSVSIPALRRTIIISLMLSVYTIPLVWYHVTYGDPTHRTTHVILETLARCVLVAGYVYVSIWPPGRASKRTIREFCCFVFIYHALSIVSTHLTLASNPDIGYYLTYTKLLWAALCPLGIWRVLRADTEYWRGMGQNAVALQGLYQQKNHIHERISSQGLHVLIEMHRKYIIDFAHLELKQRIGVGATSTVFNGILNSRMPVAVKVYTPTSFNEDVVASFSQEAALCGALHHPNIVHFFGMCVSPPTICLVSELCQGNLDDIMRANARRRYHPNRQQLLINITYMLDAARAVAYIHSFSPPFLHRDIKPSNFLVDKECNVKLTDFGESRSVFQADPIDPVAEDGFLHNGSVHPVVRPIRVPPPIEPVFSTGSRFNTKMTVKGTVDYMAPELITAKAGLASYGEAADIYSFAITMWDILHPCTEKFPQSKRNHLQTFECVMGGKRPELEQSLNIHLRDLIESAWHQDPRMRPSAQTIVNVLEAIQEEVNATFIMDALDEFPTDPSQQKSGPLFVRNVVGTQLVECMEERTYVGCPAEGIRMGNAWMDAGFLHHIKHARGFENDDSIYFFDEPNIRLCKRFAGSASSVLDHRSVIPRMDSDQSLSTITSASTHGSPDASTTVTARGSSPEHKANTTAPFDYTQRHDQYSSPIGRNCACRKFGQRLEQVKISRRKFRRKFKAIAEENVLTTALLMEEGPINNEFDFFDDRPCSITVEQS